MAVSVTFQGDDFAEVEGLISNYATQKLGMELFENHEPPEPPEPKKKARKKKAAKKKADTPDDPMDLFGDDDDEPESSESDDDTSTEINTTAQITKAICTRMSMSKSRPTRNDQLIGLSSLEFCTF